jgi:hypothetical protein
MDMETPDERIARLEQKLAQVERALGHARYESRGWSRIAHSLRIIGVCGMAATIGALMLGTAAAKPGPTSLTVKAPFTVLDNAGYKVMDVGTDGELGLYNHNSEIIRLSQGSGDTGGLMEVLTPEGETAASLAASSGGAGELRIQGTGQQFALIDSTQNQLSLRFFNGKTLKAGIGAGRTGLLELYNGAGDKTVKLGSNVKGGTVAIYDDTGTNRALLAMDPVTGHGQFSLFYRDGTTPAATLSELRGGGYFALTNPAGTARVEAGTLTTDQGILRTFGPGGFDYIRGRK